MRDGIPRTRRAPASGGGSRRRELFGGVGLLALPALFFQAAGPTLRTGQSVPQEAGTSSRLVRALALLQEGNAGEALGEAEEGLEVEPEDPDLLDVASKAALALDRPDEALAYASLALDLAGEAGDRKSFVEGLNRRIAGIDPLESRGASLLRQHAATLFRHAEGCASRGLFANAVDLYLRCGGTAFESRAAAQLERLYANRKAVEAILDSGLDVPVKAVARGSAERIAREDAKHASWGGAWEIKGPNYTVLTDMSRATAEAISTAMEQMNRFYRAVFRHRERGGGTARCVLRVYRSREEFDRYEGSPSPTVGGFYSPSENRVSTYDPRSDGRPISGLWSTLFHEASHQFTRMISADNIPGWLNEGTASYFEGARLLPNGSVETNGIPEELLLALRAILEKGEPALKDVVSFFEGGSYPGQYYPVGWGLVYFFHNYENPRSERIYRPLYGEFLDSYRAGGKHDAFERFVTTFVKKAKEPGVQTFEDFEKRFREWALTLFDLHFGPPERADLLLERARKQRKDGKPEAALESYRWALRKRPEDSKALFEMAEVELELRQKDAAILHFRRALAAERGGKDRSVPADDGRGFVEACLRRVESLDKPLAEGLASAYAGTAKGAVEAAAAYSEAGFPRAALRVLDGAGRALGGDRELRALRAEIVKSSGVDGRRWRRLKAAEGLDPWEAMGSWRVAPEGILGEAERTAFLFHREEMPEPFRFEATFRPQEMRGNGFLGLLFGANAEGGILVFGLSEDGIADFSRIAAGWKTLRVFPGRKWRDRRPVRFAVDLSEEGAEFFVDDRSVGRLPCSAEERRGQIGLVVQNARAVFADLRVRW